MKHTTRLLAFIALALTVSLAACRRDLLEWDKFSDHIEINPHYLLPLLKADITLGEILKASDTIVYTQDGVGDDLINIVFAFDSLKTLTATDYLEELPSIDTSRRTETLGLVPNEGYFEDEFVETLSFDGMLTDYFQSTIKTRYETYNGTALPAATQTEDKSSDAKSFNVPFKNVKSAKFAEGQIIAEVTNNFDVPVSFDLILTQQIGGVWEKLGTFNFDTDIDNSGGTAIDDIPARGIYLQNIQTGNFGYYLENVRIAGISGGAVEMTNTMNIRFKLSKCKLSKGEIMLGKNQQFFGTDSISYFEVTVLKKKRIYEMLVREGMLHYKSTSTFPRDIKVFLTMPEATKEGKVLTDEFVAAGNRETQRDLQLAGNHVDFTKNPDTPYNKIKIGLKYHLNALGEKEFVAFDSANRIDLLFTNADSLKFEWIKGNMELDTINIDEGQVNFNMSELLSNYFSGKITAVEPQFSLIVDNGCGIDGVASLSLSAQNSGGTERSLFKSGATQDFSILSPAFTEEISIQRSLFPFNNANSNIVNLISVIPDRLAYSGKVYTNASNAKTPDKILNHIHWDSKTNVGAELFVPLHMSIKDLTLRKHYAASFRENLIGGDIEVETLDELELYFSVKNQFPLDVKIIYTLWDTLPENDILLDTLHVTVLKAQTPDATGKVGRNSLNPYYDPLIIKGALLDNFLDANMVRTDVVLNTAGEGKNAKFYAHYNLQMGIMVGVKGKFVSK